MQQLALLTIRRQPAKKEPVIPSRVIRQYVKEALQDFPRRQRERERVRKFRVQCQEAQEQPAMRTIKVTYRAIFEQPIGALNPLGMKLPGQFPVEIFGAGDRWAAREIATARRQQYTRLPKFANPDSGKMVVTENFARQVQPWQIWGTPPRTEEGELQPERMLVPGVDICDLGNGEWGFYGPNDRTHISRDSRSRAGQWLTACEAAVSHKLIVSLRAFIAPTCPKCAEIYNREYAGK